MPLHAGDVRSHLFMVRVWTEEVDVDQVEWRGKVQRVLSGETVYFRDWETMLAFLMDKPSLHTPTQEPEEI